MLGVLKAWRTRALNLQSRREDREEVDVQNTKQSESVSYKHAKKANVRTSEHNRTTILHGITLALVARLACLLRPPQAAGIAKGLRTHRTLGSTMSAISHTQGIVYKPFSIPANRFCRK